MGMHAAEVVADIRALSPAALAGDIVAQTRLRALTDQLASLVPTARSEYVRYRDVINRCLHDTPRVAVSPLRGKRVVVTGGTGVIGSTLIGGLTLSDVGSVTSLSRGRRSGRHLPEGVEQVAVDVRDAAHVNEVLAAVRPDIVFHLAAVRDPGAAENSPTHAVTTNVQGTRVAIEAAVAAGAERFVYASTGKAVRYYTSEVYAASKRAAEYVVATRREEIAVNVARFTHVVDNSILHSNLLEFLRQDCLRIHSPDEVFHAQSARESAQLLVRGLLEPPDGTARMYSLRALEPWFSILDLAIGLRRQRRSNAWLAIEGKPAGYRSEVHPAQYDPMTTPDTGVLVNAIEARSTLGVDADELNETVMTDRRDPRVERMLDAIAELPPTRTAGAAEALTVVSRLVFEATVNNLDPPTTSRLERLRARSPVSSHPDHLVVDAVLGHLDRGLTG